MMKRKRPQGYVPGRNHLVDAALRELRKGLQPGEDPFFWDMNRDWSKVHGGDPANPSESGTVGAAEGTLRTAGSPSADVVDIRRQPTLELDLPGKTHHGEVREQESAGRGMRYMWAALVVLLLVAATGWVAFLRSPPDPAVPGVSKNQGQSMQPASTVAAAPVLPVHEPNAATIPSAPSSSPSSVNAPPSPPPSSTPASKRTTPPRPVQPHSHNSGPDQLRYDSSKE